MEPPNKGHVGTRSFVLYREVSFIRRLICTGIIGIGTSRFVLYREVSFIWRLKCTGITGIGTTRFVLYREVLFIQSVLYRRFHCILYDTPTERKACNVGSYRATRMRTMRAIYIILHDTCPTKMFYGSYIYTCYSVATDEDTHTDMYTHNIIIIAQDVFKEDVLWKLYIPATVLQQMRTHTHTHAHAQYNYYCTRHVQGA